MLLLKMKTLGLSMAATAVLIAGAYGLSGQTPTEKPAPAAPSKDTPVASAAAAQLVAPIVGTSQIIAKLNSDAHIEKPIEQAPLKDVLDFLGDKHQLSIIIDRHSFDTDLGIKRVEDFQIDLGRMPNVNLSTVLRYALAQVGGAVLVRNGYLEIVSELRAFNEAHGHQPTTQHVAEELLLRPLVSLSYSGSALSLVLADLAKQAKRNIILDSRITDREKLAVTTTLLNVPIDTALRVLAETTNLKCVKLGSVFFVTTRDRAAELQAEEENIQESRNRVTREPKPALRATNPAPKP